MRYPINVSEFLYRENIKPLRVSTMMSDIESENINLKPLVRERHAYMLCEQLIDNYSITTQKYVNGFSPMTQMVTIRTDLYCLSEQQLFELLERYALERALPYDVRLAEK